MDKINPIIINMISVEDVAIQIICKVNELVEFVDGLQKVAEKQETVK